MARPKRDTSARRRKQARAVSKGGWTHFEQLAAQQGWPLEDGERLVAALPVDKGLFEAHSGPQEPLSRDSSTDAEEDTPDAH